MIINGLEYNTDKGISHEEREVIYKFLEYYRNQDVIVADKFRLDYRIVPFDDDRVVFRSDKEFWKSIDFRRKIILGGQPYLVKLGLWRINPKENDPKCLTMNKFSISTPMKEHVINLSTDDIYENNILYNIIDVFNEKKIISPEAAYSERMITNKGLQEFIDNHEFNLITKGVKQMPELSNALFIVGEPYKSPDVFNASFGTILYQLIKYRKNHKNELTEKELFELDKVIYELSKTELLKVDLRDSTGVAKTAPTRSILLDWYRTGSQMRISEQYTVENGELKEEDNALYRVVRQFKKR